MVEETLVNPVLGYQGTPDAILRIKGDQGLTLVDWKTPRVFSKSWVIQIAAYFKLAEKHDYPVFRAASLQPHPQGGKAQFKEYTQSLKPAFAVFLSALNCWRYFNAA